MKRRIYLCLIGFVVFLGKANAQNGLLPPAVSHAGGIQPAPFEVTLSTPNPAHTIYYTLNGDRPTAKNGQRYTGPISISTTTPLSAVTVDPADADTTSAVVTRTYIFLDDVLRQPAAPKGYPTTWSRNTNNKFFPADYAMDPKICEDSEYRSAMIEAFGELPSLCVVTNRDFLFSISESPDSGGIYVHTGKSVGKLGAEWERPASVEWYDPKTGGSFQVNCGLRLHGGNSRNPSNSPKHSFRISFRQQYGATKLVFPVFDDEDAATRFDHLVLRAGYNYSWVKNGADGTATAVQRTNAQYIYDPFAKHVQTAMGHLATHDRFVHLFINGLYWGLYDVCEKTNNDFVESYWGGKDEDYDVVGDHFEVIDGDDVAYNRMFSTALAVATDADNYKLLTSEALLDLDNYIDYMLINWYIGNGDWDDNNWRVARSRVNPRNGFCYFVWDAETAFTDLDVDIVARKKGHPSQIMAALTTVPEFRQRVADRVYRHLFNGGPLSVEGATAIYQRLADQIRNAVVCESARWGDYRKMVGESKQTYTRNDHWLPRLQAVLNDYLPHRTGVLLKQLKAAGLYSDDYQPSAIDSHFANRRLHFHLPEGGRVTLRIYTVDGRLVTEQTDEAWPAGTHQTPTLHLPKGLYVYRIGCNGKEQQGKFLINK